MKNGYEQFFKEAQKATGLAAGSKKPMKKEKTQSPEAQLHERLTSRVKSRSAQAKAKRRARKFPVFPAILALVTLGTCGVGYFHPDFADQILGKVDIGVFGSANAASSSTDKKSDPAKANAAKPADKSSTGAEKTAETTTTAKDGNSPDVKNWSEEELSFFKKLNERKKELDQREAELTKLEEELQKQKVELDQKIKQLDAMRTEISKTLKSRVASDQEKVDKLVNFYSSMKPTQAAKVIETLNEDLAVEVLDKMKKKSAAEILDTMDAKKARRLSELLTGYQRTPASEAAQADEAATSDKAAKE